ncbi:MAG TPA: flagellar export protein FliJ [Solirubrobacterales bacterium]|nr:flagellar export protein FliJ [Solirubrobacterales bacterium]
MKDPGFRFRLERVHWLRQQSERSAQEALAASLRRRLDSERSLSELDARIEDAHVAEREAAASGGRVLRSGEELVAIEVYLGRLRGSRAAAARTLHEREGEVEVERRRLLAAASARHALDRLRGRRLGEHRREAARREGAQIDELALAAHRRGRAA